MALLTFNNLSKDFSGAEVFRNLDGSIEEHSSIGIVGPNGIGKTTLLQLLSGMQEPSSGRVVKGKRVRIGYLRQEAIAAFAERDNTIYEEMLTVFTPLRTQEQELRRLESKMDGSQNIDALLETYGDLLHRFEAAGGYEYEHRIERNLSGLGFSTADFSMPLAHCSGGQKTRALLCRLLLEEPDVLILDEPTNHLDAQAIEWLEGTLLRWDKAIIIVSHDRYFLDSTVGEIWEMNIHGIETYRGNYSAYLAQRDERRARREKTFNATMEFFLSELDFITRFIEKRTEQAKGRMKRLVRHVKAVEIGGPEALEKQWNVFLEESGGIPGTIWSVKDLERHIKNLRCSNPYTKPMSLRITPSDHLSDRVLTVRNAEIGYPGKVLFRLDEAEIRGRQRVALLGPNGSGKSTFLRTLIGEIPPLSGEVSVGKHVDVGYFAQSHDILDPDKSVVEELMSRKPGMLEAEARSYLGPYLFSGDDVYKKVWNLSGGERGRLILAILALRKAGLLVLDEPTNHLDIQSREILEEALMAFEGTILLVTHDRYLIDRIATRIFYIQDNDVVQFEGTYREYRDAMRVPETEVSPTREKVNGKPRTDTGAGTGKHIASVEEEIVTLESRIGELEASLETAIETNNEHRIGGWKTEYIEKQARLRELLDTWEKLSVE